MTIFDELTAAGLPVISADESGAISMGAMDENQRDKFRDITLAHFNPTAYAELQSERANKAQIKAEFIATLDTLTQIENAVTPTNAQIVAAVKFIAKTLKLLLKLIARTL